MLLLPESGPQDPGKVIEYGIPSVAWSSFKAFHNLIEHSVGTTPFHNKWAVPSNLLRSSLKVNSERHTPIVGGSPTPTHGNGHCLGSATIFAAIWDGVVMPSTGFAKASPGLVAKLRTGNVSILEAGNTRSL